MDYLTFYNNILKTSNTIVKLDISYNHGDGRCWSVVINPESQNIIVTYVINRTELGYQGFDILSSKHIITDILMEDIYDVIENLTSQNSPTVVESK